jgi:GntR family transcriptional regulator
MPPGSPIPSEHALMQRYGVSRGTVRQATSVLRAEGAISGSQGRRMIACEPVISQPLGQLISFTAWVRQLGKVPSATVLRFERRKPAPEIQRALNLDRDSPVPFLFRVRQADGEPLLIERTWFNPAIEGQLRGIDFERESIYEALERQGIVVASAQHQIGASVASREDASVLHLPIRSPLLHVERTGYDAQGRPIEYSDDRYVGSRVNFLLENSANAPAAGRRLENAKGR